ncbi:Aminopeptidase N, partial [Trachymyrmex cornetzi]
IFICYITGYYRVNYELTMWQRIAYYLNSDNYKNIHVLNRAQILDDAFHLAIEEKTLSLSTFWNLSHYLSRETDYVAWYPMIKAFEYMSIFIPFSEIGLEEEMRKILPTLFKKIGYQEIPNENDLTKCLRQEIAKWACVLGDSDCRINATSRLEWHFTNPEKHKILPWWKEWTFCKGLIKANGSIWMKMLDISEREHDKQILEYLTCSENPNIIQIYLNKITENMSLKINDRVNIFLRIIAKHAKNIEILEYILENFEKIKPRWLNAVHFQPIRGRRLFPCWDEPAFKTTFKISIKHHKEYMALSNMPSQTFELADNNMIWTHFHPTPLMSTYRVAVVLATFPFDGINAFHFERETVWCRKYSAPYTKFVKTIFTRVTSHLRIRFNIKIAKLDHVVLPESKSMWNWYLRDGMSQWGFIFYRERRIMYNEAIDPPSHKIEVTRLVTYELAHHWSSNFITLSSWSYLWITDALKALPLFYGPLCKVLKLNRVLSTCLTKEMRIILPTLFKEIGYQEITNEDDFTKYLRQEIAKWACVLGDSDCRINAASKLEWHITNPEKHKILPWWKEWTFCNGLIKANGSTWMKMMDIFKRDHDIQILEYLTCSENPNIIQIYLNKITENMSLEINDRVNIFLRIIAKHAKNIEILKYILENFEKIKPRYDKTLFKIIL